jgi:hypothetical protein
VGVDFCNIHVAGVKHCPWCSYDYWGYVPFVAIVLVQAAVIFRGQPPSIAVRALLAFVAFPVTGGAFALLFGWLSGFWAD